jgi:hypothetical protein
VSMNVRIFHYEPTFKFFLVDEVIQDQRPDIGLPAHSTDIAPPFESFKEGWVAVFDGGSWEMVVDTFWRPRKREENYDAGRLSSTYKPLEIARHQFPRYPSMPMLCNTELVVSAICQRIFLIEKKFSNLLLLHKKINAFHEACNLGVPDISQLEENQIRWYEYKLGIEETIYLMRRVLDSLVQLTFLLTSYPDFLETKKIDVNEIGKVFDTNLAKTNLGKIILGDVECYQKDETNFLRVINDLFNSFKHSLMHDESYLLFCSDLPSVTSYQAKHNDHRNEIVFHNHNFFHLMMGFQDSVVRILENQRIYQKLQATSF